MNLGTPEKTIAHCPVDRCRWTLDITPPSLASLGLTARSRDALRGEGRRMVDRAYARHRERIEHETQAHIYSHPGLELVATIVRLRDELDAARAEQPVTGDDEYELYLAGSRDLVGHLLKRHLYRTGANDAYTDDAYTKTTVDYASNVLRLVQAAMDDENVDRHTARRVLERVIYGAVPSPADVAYRKLQEQQMIDLASRTSFRQREQL